MTMGDNKKSLNSQAEEQARKNLAVMIPWLESQFPSLKEVE